MTLAEFMHYRLVEEQDALDETYDSEESRRYQRALNAIRNVVREGTTDATTLRLLAVPWSDHPDFEQEWLQAPTPAASWPWRWSQTGPA